MTEPQESAQPSAGGAPSGRREPRESRREGRGPGGDRPGGDRAASRGGPSRPSHQPWQKTDFLARAVKEEIDREFLQNALEFARSVGPGIAGGQVRGLYGEVLRQQLCGLDPPRLLLLKPRLAYLAARGGRSELRDLRAVLERAVEAVCEEGIEEGERRARFGRFAQGFEAILAYQKLYERKQGEWP